MLKTEIDPYRLSRRGFLNAAALGAASIAVSACATTTRRRRRSNRRRDL